MAEIANLKALLSLDSTKFEQGAKRARKQTRSLQDSLSSLKNNFVALAGAAGIGLFIKNTLDSADAIAKLSDRTGLSTDAIQEMRHAFSLAGIDAATSDNAFIKFGKNLGDLRQETGALTTFLNKYDQQLAENLKNAKNNTQALDLYLDAMGGAKNQADKLALAQAGLGRSGALMTSAFVNGTAEFKASRAEAQKLGLVLDESLLKNAEEINDNFERLTKIVLVNFQKALLQNIPTINKLVTALMDIAQLLGELNKPSSMGFFEKLARFSAAGALSLGGDVFGAIGKLGTESEFLGGFGATARLLDRAEENIFKTMLDAETKGGEGVGAFSLDKPKLEDIGQADTAKNDDIEFRTELLKSEFDMLSLQQDKEEELDNALKEREKAVHAYGTGLKQNIKILEAQALGEKELAEILEIKFQAEEIAQRALTEREEAQLKQFVTEKQRLESVINENERAAQTVQQVWEAVGRGTEDAFVDMITGVSEGLEGLRSIALSVLSDIARIMVRKNITEKLFSETGIVSTALSGFSKSLFGFAHGGSFEVGGSGGVDSSLVAFKATPGERVTISNDESGGGGNVTFVMNNEIGIAPTVRAELARMRPVIQGWVMSGLVDAKRRNIGDVASTFG